MSRGARFVNSRHRRALGSSMKGLGIVLGALGNALNGFGESL
jgi:hypothetical protein